MTAVFIKPIQPDEEPANGCPPERIEYINSAANEELRRMRAAASNALLCACESLGISLRDAGLHREADGRWRAAGFFLSISHCVGFAAAAVSDMPVGIDIEPVSRAGAGLLKSAGRICTPGELRSSPAAPALLELWTKKEAIFKCSGSAVFRPELIEVSGHPVFSFRAGREGELILSLCCGDGPENIRFAGLPVSAQKG